MGPRSADRGIPGVQQHIWSSSIGLQWGRDQLIAELIRTRGRGKAAARASMGPRSADRGIASTTPVARHLRRLQWGRDQLIAELGPLPVVITAKIVLLQWGRDQLIAEFYRILKADARREIGFNGAAIS